MNSKYFTVDSYKSMVKNLSTSLVYLNLFCIVTKEFVTLFECDTNYMKCTALRSRWYTKILLISSHNKKLNETLIKAPIDHFSSTLLFNRPRQIAKLISPTLYLCKITTTYWEWLVPILLLSLFSLLIKQIL